MDSPVIALVNTESSHAPCVDVFEEYVRIAFGSVTIFLRPDVAHVLAADIYRLIAPKSDKPLTSPHTGDEKAALRDAGRSHLIRP